MKRIYKHYPNIFNFKIGKKLNIGLWKCRSSTVFRWINLHPKNMEVLEFKLLKG